MRNPNFVPPVIVPVNPARLNVIEALVRAHLLANAAKSDIDDVDIIALAPEFAAVPGTLKAIKDRIGLT
jgi:hypothetical protein